MPYNNLLIGYEKVQSIKMLKLRFMISLH